MKISLVDTFYTRIDSKIPPKQAGGKPTLYQFDAEFKFFPQNDETKAEFEKINLESGATGLLNHVMVGTRCITPTDVDFVDENDQKIDVAEFVKQHPIFQSAHVMGFYGELNKGIEEKNSKKSR